MRTMMKSLPMMMMDWNENPLNTCPLPSIEHLYLSSVYSEMPSMFTTSTPPPHDSDREYLSKLTFKPPPPLPTTSISSRHDFNHNNSYCNHNYNYGHCHLPTKSSSMMMMSNTLLQGVEHVLEEHVACYSPSSSLERYSPCSMSTPPPPHDYQKQKQQCEQRRRHPPRALVLSMYKKDQNQLQSSPHRTPCISHPYTDYDHHNYFLNDRSSSSSLVLSTFSSSSSNHDHNQQHLNVVVDHQHTREDLPPRMNPMNSMVRDSPSSTSSSSSSATSACEINQTNNSTSFHEPSLGSNMSSQNSTTSTLLRKTTCKSPSKDTSSKESTSHEYHQQEDDDSETKLSPQYSKQKIGKLRLKTSATKSIATQNKNGHNKGWWTEEEHERFLQGLKECGNNWKLIAEKYVKSRSRTQVASHGQKWRQSCELQDGAQNSVELLQENC
ncbi:hypothetical protein C9374_014255 [Naegleria lovaniensis]|uniref:Uncharacterized protein n=1 Tax=Naegleria lovaniensis TaxID=51637 RepID=A0AA88G4T0_NAELO|nr:uncharacterized protein C9374_014255 [Naegleria lovaniensis]KAG2370761.1 hypothetical protein C9374_014255 [Naegleria lovaniensis]